MYIIGLLRKHNLLEQMIVLQMPMYQPSGESDKENKRLEALQSPSSSDKSLNDLPPPRLFRYFNPHLS